MSKLKTSQVDKEPVQEELSAPETEPALTMADILESKGLAKVSIREFKNSDGKLLKSVKSVIPEPMVVGLMYFKGWKLSTEITVRDFDAAWSAFQDKKLGEYFGK